MEYLGKMLTKAVPALLNQKSTQRYFPLTGSLPQHTDGCGCGPYVPPLPYAKAPPLILELILTCLYLVLILSV
jgi:hypothetical protein